MKDVFIVFVVGGRSKEKISENEREKTKIYDCGVAHNYTGPPKRLRGRWTFTFTSVLIEPL